METLLTILPILAILTIGIISPGPSFILVARTAVAHSRRAAVVSSIGMALGAMILSIAALFGLHALLNQIPSAYLGLKIFGGIYLIYLAYKTWVSAPTPLKAENNNNSSEDGLFRHFWIAAVTMLSNPKAAVQYGIIFAAMLPESPTFTVMVVLPISVFTLEVVWYLTVAFLLSSAVPRNTYLRAKTRIDRTVGFVLGLLGFRLLLSFK